MCLNVNRSCLGAWYMNDSDVMVALIWDRGLIGTKIK
jgi:hypothetical protein